MTNRAESNVVLPLGRVRNVETFVEQFIQKTEILSWEGRVKRPDDFERAWCSVLKAHSRSSEPLKALSAFEKMLKTNETETKKSLLAPANILMSACVKGGRPDWARDMLEKAKENGLKPDSISYATCAAGETQAARGILGSDYACDVETLKRLFASTRKYREGTKLHTVRSFPRFCEEVKQTTRLKFSNMRKTMDRPRLERRNHRKADIRLLRFRQTHTFWSCDTRQTKATSMA